MSRRPKAQAGGGDGGAAEALRPLLYGNLPPERWPEHDAGGDPWDRFAAARRAAGASDLATAVAIWETIVATPGLEPRHYLQAWTFLRRAGAEPPTAEAKRVLGVVAEMPVGKVHDVLAAYEDGSCRYLNHAGKVVVVEGASIEATQAAARSWLGVGRLLARATGPWQQPELPAVPSGHARVMVLTPSGPHFGQGPEQLLVADNLAKSFVQAAIALLEVIVKLTSK